ncbi:hypothetical protein [Aquibacillus halophilus]
MDNYMAYILLFSLIVPSEVIANKSQSENSLGVNSDILTSTQKKTDSSDFTKEVPSFYTKLSLPEVTVMQCFVINELSDELYVSQVIPSSDASESYRLSRFTIDGTYLDSMVLRHGGHGTTFGIENSESDVYIWSSYDVLDKSANVTGHDLVRFKYEAGLTLNEASSALTRYDKFTNEYVNPTIDQKNNTIVFRVGIGQSKIELRSLNDVKNGINQLNHSFLIPDDLEYFQGMSLDGENLYWYTGDVNSVTHDREITLFDFSKGTIKKRVTVDFGKDSSGKYEKGFSEPEGIYLYTDPNTGAKSLFAGVVTGGKGKRINKIYRYHLQIIMPSLIAQ